VLVLYGQRGGKVQLGKICVGGGCQPGTAIAPPLDEVGLPGAYRQFFGIWLPQSGEEAADSPVFEVCLNSPMDTAQDQL
jgi:DNA gyrase inhibitor GyrI